MRTDLSLPLQTVFGFLLALARVSGVIVFTPIPGFQGASDAARIILALALTFILLPVWPTHAIADLSIGKLTGWICAEFTYGLLIGVCVSFLLDGLQMAAQMIGLQAGYSFASTIDPNTQADSTVLQTITQLAGGVLFFVLGLDRDIVHVLAGSLLDLPAVGAQASLRAMDAVVHLGSGIFTVGVRLALPVLALLILMDLAFAVLAKLHAQFQATSLSFALKMLGGLGLLATTLSAIPAVERQAARITFGVLNHLIGR